MTKNANRITGRTAVLIAAVSFAAILSLAVFAVACDDCGSDGAGGDVGTKFDFEGMQYEVTSKGPGKNYAALVKGKDVQAVIIPEFAKAGVIEYKVTEIKEKAFKNSSAVSVVMPDSIRTIGDSAFYDNEALNSLTFSKGLNSIGSNAFHNCMALKSIDIPEGTTSIGDSAFLACWYLDLIKIPASLSSIGERAFSFTSTSTNFTVNEGNTKYKSVDGVLFNASMDTVIKGRDSDAFAIPSSVKTIAHAAFSRCNFTSVTIPAGATSIGDYAFSNCGLLNSVSLPASLTSIGDYAFRGCKMTSASLPASLTSIGEGAFSECRLLKSVSMSDDVTYIGKNAFEFCMSLSSFRISSKITSISDGMFYNCTSLKSIIIPSGIKSIGANAFLACTAMTEMVFLGTVMPTCGKGALDLGNITVSVLSKFPDPSLAPGVTGNTKFVFSKLESKYTVTINPPATGGSVTPSAGTHYINAGDDLKITAKPSEGYSFKCFYVDTVMVSDLPEYTIQRILSNTSVSAEFEKTPTTDVNCTVSYNASDGTALKPQKTVAGKVGTEVTEQALPIAGYVPDKQSKSLVLKASGNEITFVYSAVAPTDVNCTVSYKAADGTVLKPQKTVTGKVGSEITETAPTVAGYVPDKQSKSLVLLASGNEIAFVYTPEASPAPAGDSAVLVIAVIAVVCLGAAGAAVWFFKFRKP